MVATIETTGAYDSGITETFEYVFYEGQGGFSTLVPFPWPISIGGRPFVIDLAHYQWALPDMMRQAIDFQSSPGEGSFDTGGVWLRSNGDWSLGAGQEYHDASDSNQRLFAASRGIDPWTKRQIALQPDTEQMLASAALAPRLLPHGSYLYLMGDTTLQRTNNPQSAAPSFTDITGLAGSMVGLCTDGGLIYVVTTTGIFTHDPAGTSAVAYGGAASATLANVLRFANGWLIAGVGNVLSSIDAAGALTTITTHRVAAFRWTAIVGAPSGIYAGGQGADVAEILHVGFDDQTGGLGVPVHACELPRGEQLRSLAYYGSSLLIGTSKGFRIGQINGDVNATVDLGPLISTSGADVFCAFGESKFVYFGWSNYDSTHTGVGRANLAEYRARQQPAFASDVMAVAQGDVTDVCRFDNHTYFAVAGSGFWREQYQGNRVPTGTIRLGKSEWGTFEPKTFLGVQLTTLPLVGTVGASVTDDTGVAQEIGTLSTQGSTGLGVLLGTGLGGLSTYYEVTLTLNRDVVDPTDGPTVRLVTSRALVVPHAIQRWVLPIICKSIVLTGKNDDIEQSQDVGAIRNFFLGLRRSGEPVTYQEGADRHTVVVRDVAYPDGQVERWGVSRDGLQGLLLVTIDSTGS